MYLKAYNSSCTLIKVVFAHALSVNYSSAHNLYYQIYNYNNEYLSDYNKVIYHFYSHFRYFTFLAHAVSHDAFFFVFPTCPLPQHSSSLLIVLFVSAHPHPHPLPSLIPLPPPPSSSPTLLPPLHSSSL